MKKSWFEAQLKLSSEAKVAKAYVMRICALLTKLSGRKFYVEMSKYNNCYEGHMIDTGKCIEGENGEFKLSDVGNEIGMIFWGGFFSTKRYNDALSRAWISLLEDCVGNSEDGKLASFHNLTDSLEDFGPHIDLNCKTVEKLEELLKGHNC